MDGQKLLIEHLAPSANNRSMDQRGRNSFSGSSGVYEWDGSIGFVTQSTGRATIQGVFSPWCAHTMGPNLLDKVFCMFSIAVLIFDSLQFRFHHHVAFVPELQQNYPV